jgi:uncharacterized protein
MRYFWWIVGLLIAVSIVFLSWFSLKQVSPVADIPITRSGPKPKLALVLDDFGYSNKNFDVLTSIDVPLTLAVLPGIRYSNEACAVVVHSNMEVILHLPMEPMRENAPIEKDTILVDMDDAAIKSILEKSLNSVPGARGVSNHMGSKATGDARVMKVVFGELKRRDMFFLDSMTTPDSVCAAIASEMDVPYVKRDIFIDNVQEEAAIIKQIGKALKIARAKGEAVAIGHDRKITVEALKLIVPYIQKRGIELVALSELVEKELEGEQHPAGEDKI